MRTLEISREEAGRRLERYLMRMFPTAPRSFLYKALRTNKIKVNGRKPLDLNYMLQESDVLSVYFTEEQWQEFSRKTEERSGSKGSPVTVPVLYEDEDLIIFNKPAGLLSQKDHTGEASLNEIGRQMLEDGGLVFSGSFRPGVCHRLDRNTAGAVIMAKNLKAAQAVQELIASKKLEKYYTAVTEGRIPWKTRTLKGYWIKDEKSNRAKVLEQFVPGSSPIELICRVKATTAVFSLVEICLLTGKSHQIRAQLAGAGFPLVGDSKYGGGAGKGQLLCANRLVFPDCPPSLENMTGKVINAPLPKAMQEFINKTFSK